MDQSHECPRCQGPMSEGFVVDKTHGSPSVASWVSGAPQKSLLVGLKLRGKTSLEITTSRFRRCGFLESYAPDA